MMPIRVLVVDHDPACCDAIRAILDQVEDLTVIGTASNGQEALHAATTLCPDVVVLDVQVPKLDGIAVTKALGCECRRPAVVLLSVYPTRHDEACDAGVSCFLLKDTSASALIDAVRASAARRWHTLEVESGRAGNQEPGARLDSHQALLDRSTHGFGPVRDSQLLEDDSNVELHRPLGDD